LAAAWSRQMSDDSAKRNYPLSRRYFMHNRKPRLTMSEYYGLIELLNQAGLVLNRSGGRSGKLALRPKLALNQVKYYYGLRPV